MAYIYLLDRFDILNFSNVSDAIAELPITQWFSNQQLLSTTHTMLIELAKSQKQPNPFAAIKATTPSAPQIQTALTKWLFERECIYLDIMIANYQPGSPIPKDLSYLSTEDGIGLALEYLTAEYQSVIYTRDLKEIAALQTAANATSSTITTVTSTTIGDNNTNVDDIIIDQKSTNDLSDLNILLQFKPEQPSLAQKWAQVIHTLTIQLTEIDMYMTSFDLQHKPNSTISTLKQKQYAATALSSISPPKQFSIADLQQFDQRLSELVAYFNTQTQLYHKSHVLQPILANLHKSLFSSVTQTRLFSAIDKSQMNSLTKSEISILHGLLDELRGEYEARHKQLLLKLLTQTQTFIFSLKLKYLQLKQQESRKDFSTTAKPKQQKKKQDKPKPKGKGKPIEDGADGDSDGDDEMEPIGPSIIANVSTMTVENQEYHQIITKIVNKYRQVVPLLAYVDPVTIGDVFMVSSQIALVLSHGNEKQLNRPRAKFQYQDHPRMNMLGVMQDRGGRL